MEIYVIQPGDSLFLIAQRFGTTVAAIQALNQLSNPGRLVVGQAILIPPPPEPLEPLRYTVQRGDSLFAIAQLFGVTGNAIAQANNIANPNLIQAGQSLLIPGWSQVVYTVQPGDSLYMIANRYGVSVNWLARVNGIADPASIYPGQVIIVPQPASERPLAEVMGYFQTANTSGLERTLTQYGDYLTYGVLFQYPVDAAGSITIPATTERAVAIMRANNVRPLPSVTNYGPNGFDPDLARTIMSDEAVKARTIANILALLDRYGFAGVNIDFENMHPEDRQLYNAFVRDLAAALRPRGYPVTLAVAPKYSDQANQPWVGAFDYATLGQLADIIFIMTYEWGWIGGPPMAVAPLNLVRRTIAYATSLIPANKIIMGVPFYGYNWPLPDTPETLATPVNLIEVYSLAYDNGAAINYNPTAQSPWFRYTDQQGRGHEVWFEDVRSLAAKYETAREFGLRGVGYWSFLNDPYGTPQNWPVLENTFIIAK